MEEKTDFNSLPEGCISEVLSRTTPRDAGVLSSVSSVFRSAADSDVVWERFLPPDYSSFLSRAVHPVEYSCKKELYFQLCYHPVLIDDGKLCFGLEKFSGAKCFTIPTRELNISLPPGYGSWEFEPCYSRFCEAAKLHTRISIPIRSVIGRIRSKNLSPHTKYESYLIFRRPTNNDGAYRWEIRRRDGWREVCIGKFYKENAEDVDIEIRFCTHKMYLNSGTVILGVELRPMAMRPNPL